MGAAIESSTPPTKLGLPSTYSPSSNSSPIAVCRICHEDGRSESLVSPCRCSGSVGLVHVHCLEKWLTSANKNHCEICMFKYSTQRRPKPIHQWLCGLSLADESRRHLCGDSACFMLITSLAMLGDYLCLLGISHYMIQMKRWQAVGLMILAFVISLVYISWLLVTCKYHWIVWREWRRENQQVRLVRLHSISSIPVITTTTSSANNNNNNVVDSGAGAMVVTGLGTCANTMSGIDSSFCAGAMVGTDSGTVGGTAVNSTNLADIDRHHCTSSENSVSDSAHNTAFIGIRDDRFV